MLQHPEEMEQDVPNHAWETSGTNLRGIRILLAEDGYDNRELIRTILKSAGAEVELAENGRVAAEKAESDFFDLILMDMNMPEMDGLEATRLLRDRGFRRPILALTANAMEGDSVKCREAGCNEHLVKPIDRVRLIRTIAFFVRGEENGVSETAQMPPADASCVQVDPIASLFADDPEMMCILDEFVKNLHEHVGVMRQSLASNRYEELQRCAHKLKGAGGSYGYPSLTEACKVLEDAAKARDRSACLVAIDLVAVMCKAIQNGYSISTSAEQATC
jgi:CheY-like chemotaxis protein/HPt (histidine-containing phosphotransfer) domain-containing protein